MEHHVGLFSHFAQHLATGESRADSIAIGTRVRRQHKSLVLSDLPEYILEHAVRPDLHWIPCGAFVFFFPALTIPRPELSPVRRDPGGNTTRALAGCATVLPTRDGYIREPLPALLCCYRLLRRRPPH